MRKDVYSMSDFVPIKPGADYACRYSARPYFEFLLKDGTRRLCFEDRLMKDGARINPDRVDENNSKDWNLITDDATNTLLDETKVVQVYVSKGVNRIGSWPFSGFDSLAYIVVDEKNKHFYARDGVLFSRDDSLLIAYPPMHAATEYTVPAEV